jgi:sensor c-di-GMP phosphodiesterase-like protein
MKKQLLALAAACVTLWGSGTALAAKPVEWSLLGENPSGAYYADLASFQQQPKTPDITTADTRAVIKSASFIRLLNHLYEKHLPAADSAKECLMTVEVNEKDHTYRIDQIQVLTRKGKSLEKKKVKEEFSPIPQKTFVAALEKEIQAWGVEKGKVSKQ